MVAVPIIGRWKASLEAKAEIFGIRSAVVYQGHQRSQQVQRTDKRLTDGQFDHCDLTFRELSLVEDAIINRVSAIHHGRISYPSGKTDKPEEAPGESGPRTATA